MQFFIRSVITHIKILITPSFILTLLLFPLAVFVISFFGSGDMGKIKIGLMYDEAPLTTRIIERFQEYVGEDAEFILFSDRDKMERAVAGQTIECGYEMNKELKIVLYKGPLAVSHEVFNLMLSSALIETMSGELGAEVLKKYFPDAPGLVKEIQSGADAYAAEGPAMDIQIVSVSAREGFGSGEGEPLNRRLHGLTALFAFLLSLLCADAFFEDGNLFSRLRAAGAGRVILHLLAKICVILLFLSVFFIMSLGVGGVNPLITVSFCFALACFSMFLSLYIKKEMISLIPFLFVVTACLGQTLFNIEEIAMFLKPFTYFTFTSYYMEGIIKTLPWLEAGLLGLIAALFAGLACCCAALRR